MKILSGAPHFNEEVAVASEAVGDAWLVLAQPIVVRDADVIDLKHNSLLTSAITSIIFIENYALLIF